MASVNDREIKIGIVTTGDTSGIEKVIDAEKRLNEQTSKGDSSGSRGFGGMLDVPKVKAAAEAHKQLGDSIQNQADVVEKALSRISQYGGPAGRGSSNARSAAIPGEGLSKIVSDATAVSLAVTAIAKAAEHSYNFLNATVDEYKGILEEAGNAGVKLPEALKSEVEALESTMSPLRDTIAGIKSFISNPLGTITGSAAEAKALRESLEAQIEAAYKLKKTREEAASGNQTSLSEIYGIELARLKEQEATIARIANLRNQLNQVAAAGADQEIEIAKLRGGDVAAAEASALAQRLQAGLASVGDKLRQAVAAQNTAEGQYNEAFGKYQQAITDRLNELKPDEFRKIDATLNAATTALSNANQTVEDQKRIFDQSRLNVLRGAEIELNKLETEFSGQVSSSAKAGFDQVYRTLQEEVAKGPAEAISRIEAATAPITEAAGQKASEIGANIATAAEQVSQRGTEIQTSFSTFGTKLEERDGKILDGIQTLMRIGNSSAARFAQIESQLATLEERFNQQSGQ